MLSFFAGDHQGSCQDETGDLKADGRSTIEFPTAAKGLELMYWPEKLWTSKRNPDSLFCDLESSFHQLNYSPIPSVSFAAVVSMGNCLSIAIACSLAFGVCAACQFWPRNAKERARGRLSADADVSSVLGYIASCTIPYR